LGGSGPTKAWYTSDPTLVNHTIYAPKAVNPNAKLPLIVWGNGACGADGAGFSNFLTEIASHGFMVISSGAPKSPFGSTTGKGGLALLASTSGDKTRAYQMTEAINWAFDGAAGGKYGVPDTTKVATAGQSCGGLEAYSAAYKDSRVRMIGIFNSGVIDDSIRPMLAQIKVPVGIFLGGPSDIAYVNVSVIFASAPYSIPNTTVQGERDYKELPAGLPVLKGEIDMGHMGDYFFTQGGKFGKAAVNWLKWMFKDDVTSKLYFFEKNSPLVADGWEFVARGSA
jgi:dienelactone hydrolase